MKLKIDHKLALERINLSYLEDVFLSFDSEVIKYLPLKTPPKEISITKKFIEDAQERFAREIDLNFVILKESNFVGCCGIRGLNTKRGDFGYWIKKSEQGKGIGKKVASYLIHWSFENYELEYIKYPVDKRNLPSIKIIESIGGKIYDQYPFGEENCLDILEYRVMKGEAIH